MSTTISKEIHRRIQVSVWAYAYEIKNESLVPDHDYDQTCLLINKDMSTSYEGRNNTDIDRWFRNNFDPSTGMWIRNHPNLEGIERYYQLWKAILPSAANTYPHEETAGRLL